MAIEDKELFIQTVKDVMIPVAGAVVYLIITVLLALMWMPMMFVMTAIGVGIVISFMTYKDRLEAKKREAERKLEAKRREEERKLRGY
jgi:uncharacterized protein YacL